MLPIHFAMSRRFAEASLTGLTLLLLSAGGVLGTLKAGPLPAFNAEDFRTLIDYRHAPNYRELVFPELPVAVQNLADYRRRLRKAAQDLPSLGEVSTVLLMTEWSSAGLFGLEAVVPLDQVKRAVLQKDDDAFKGDVVKLMEGHTDNPREISEVNQAIVAEIKREVRLQLLDRLENRLRFFFAQGRNADRVAAANLISDIMNTSRRQDVSQISGLTGEVVLGVMVPKPQDIIRGSPFRERLRSLSGDLEKQLADPNTQVRVAAIRALSDLEWKPGELVARLKPLLASQQSDAPTRRAAEEALGHILEVYTARMDKSSPQRYLTAVEQVLPAAAEGLSDSDALVRRASLESCQQAALVMEALATDPLATGDRQIVFRPTLAVVLTILP